MYVRTLHPSPVQGGDLVMRPKESGIGFHYGTGLSNGMVKDKMPRVGHAIRSLDRFCAGKPVTIVRFNRSPEENMLVEYRALTNPNKDYTYEAGNCEHDMTYAQYGLEFSPTADSVKLLLVAGGALLACKVLSRV